MKIVDAKIPKSKSETFREIIREISGKEKAALLETESDRTTFCQIARSMGFKPKTKKLSGKGWLIFII